LVDKNRPVHLYMALQYMASPVPDRELKKGSAELMILALLEDRARHGYEIGQLIELRSRGAIRFNVASLIRCFIDLRNGTGSVAAGLKSRVNAGAATIA